MMKITTDSDKGQGFQELEMMPETKPPTVSAHVTIFLLPCELQHPATARDWALACLKLNAGTLAETDPYGGSEVGILADQVWFTHYLIALAKLTLEGRRIVDAARGNTMEGAS